MAQFVQRGIRYGLLRSGKSACSTVWFKSHEEMANKLKSQNHFERLHTLLAEKTEDGKVKISLNSHQLNAIMFSQQEKENPWMPLDRL